MSTLEKLTALENSRWKSMRVNASKINIIDSVARRLLATKERVMDVALQTGVPWPVILVIKERESGADPKFLRNIAQGDPWTMVSRHVPSGRGPFNSWDEAAVDALVNCAPRAARWKDWSPGGTMCILEQYNGLGYYRRGIPSPYIWSFTDQYRKGKYVADGKFDPNAVDQQIGCAALLARMIALDPSANFFGASQVVPVIESAPKPPPPPSPKAKAATTAIASGAAAAGAAHSSGLSPQLIIVVVVIAVAIALAIMLNRKG